MKGGSGVSSDRLATLSQSARKVLFCFKKGCHTLFTLKLPFSHIQRKERNSTSKIIFRDLNPTSQKTLYVGLLISLWPFLFLVFLFAAQPKEFFLDGLKKLEQRRHKWVELRGGHVE
jgi:hypothetical protein